MKDLNTSSDKTVVFRSFFLVWFIQTIGVIVFVTIAILLSLFLSNQSQVIIITFSILIPLLAIIIYRLLYLGSQRIYIINNTMLVYRRGLFTLKESTFPLSSINQAMISQTLLGRLLDYGNIRLQISEQVIQINNVAPITSLRYMLANNEKLH